ncbi:hypothetical protein [Pseudoroseicyclus aestuarii]|uniref:Lipoprotein n=1 Tax=Pseudoroseicyclus aestuarii TaxID=1795041 RepID=A0A318SZD7_9RHOB|nr:hypothetical protein [Pseudoroseicyclus aestuarii]PYE85776.1 hypothetical protein DFP88_101448 [Pseudoroseicyclus aestuarii]
MKILLIACLAACLGGCSAPNFVGDAAPISQVEETPDRFELPARFALARSVYGHAIPAGADEAALWTDLAERASSLGSFTPLVSSGMPSARGGTAALIETARQQRYAYLILLRMQPETGSADIVLYHTASGGVMATAQAVSPAGGRRGFWGGPIRNPAQLERVTADIAQAALPVVEEMLRGIARRPG